MSDNSPHSKIPEPALRRLPWYLSYVKLLKKQGHQQVSSTQIAKKINVSATQIAKDLSYVNINGKTRVGYNIEQLISLGRLFRFQKNAYCRAFWCGKLRRRAAFGLRIGAIRIKDTRRI